VLSVSTLLDLNHGSGCTYGPPPAVTIADRINAQVDAALLARQCHQAKRDYLGGSRIGGACARRLAYGYLGAEHDPDRGFDGRTLRIFAVGHAFEDLTIGWLVAAGFKLRTRDRSGRQYGFSTAGGRLRGYIDGVIVDGPEVGIEWPALFEHKALNERGWTTVREQGVARAKPVYWAQVYMGYLEIERTLFTALNKNTQALHHELVRFDPPAAQRLSDKAVEILRAVEAGELLPRVAATPDHHACRFCPFPQRCWSAAA
jgi:hypothetical protein